MKTALLFLAAALMAAPTAMASKARTAALSESAWVGDVQDIFANPAFLMEYGEFMTIETGAGEAGFSKNYGEAKLGFYLGRQSADTAAFRAGAGVLGQENPFEVFYAAKAGDMTWGASFTHSSTERKSTKDKQSTMGMRVGAFNDMWDIGLNMGLGSTAEDNATVGAEKKYKGTSGMTISAGYNVSESLYAHISNYASGFQLDVGGQKAAEQEMTGTTIGVASGWKKDGVEFFYGADYEMATNNNKFANTKTETTNLPVHFGIEAEAASWLTLRASASQTVLMSSSKTTGGEADSNADNTTAALGAGLKFGKLTIDGAMSASVVDFTGSLMTNTALTYMF
jgi:hypothetical protein